MNKKKGAIILFFAAALLSLFSISTYTQELSGCCCDFETGIAQSQYFLVYTDCLATNNFVLPNAMDMFLERTCNEICAIRAGIVPPEEGIPEVPAQCGVAGYAPAPQNVRASPIKGEKQVRVSWETICPADYFVVSRCSGSLCTDLADQIGVTYYIDDDEDLKWDEEYTYVVIAHYNLQGDSEENSTTVTTGDIECWKQFGEQQFCLSSLYYREFEDYFINNGYKLSSPGDFATNVTDAIRNQFFDRFNMAASCDEDNIMSTPADICESQGLPGGICIADEMGADCVIPSDCETVEAGGAFGLFFGQTECEEEDGEKKFCFLDKSKSIIEKCYPCSQGMSCYDYRSQSACERDNCGVGDCVWNDVYPDIGIGVCFDRRFSACHLCELVPEGGSSEAFNIIYEQCSSEKSTALSTADYPCYWGAWGSLSCDEVTCRTYRRAAECGSPSGGIALYENNSLMRSSSDQCKIGVCQWEPDDGLCYKNADGDTGLWPDCTFADDPQVCALDYIPPETEMVATGALGVYDKININIFDKISRTDPGEYKTGSKAMGYITHFCHYPEGSSPCDVHTEPIDTEVSSLILNYLTLHNTKLMEGQQNLTVLAQGYNIIRYYTEDPSKNLGVVKELRVYACARCTGPQIINFYIENGIERGGDIYTNEERPIFHADFNIESEITTAEIDTMDDVFVSSLSYSAPDSMNYTFIAETGLPEGRYKFRINAQDDEGTFMNDEFVKEFVVDFTPSVVNFTIDGEPAEGMLVTKKTANVQVRFFEPVATATIRMNEKDASDDFTTNDDMIFSAANFQFDEGTIFLSTSAVDLAENIIDEGVTFYVNAEPPVIMLREPTYGVSDDFKFDIVVETLNDVDCRYIYDVPIPENFTYTDFSAFDETGGSLHTIRDFTKIPDGDYSNHTLHVFCNDPMWGLSNRSFTISVDNNRPVIATAIAVPSTIKEAIEEDTYRTLLKVNTNEPTFCKYSSTTDSYAAMEETFPDYKAIPQLNWPNDHDIARNVHGKYIFVDNISSYTYYTACEDLAGLVSETKEINFDINLNVSFNVTSKTKKYWNTTSITLAVETNKRAYCYYGRNEDSITSSFQNDGEYAHTTQLTNLDPGNQTFYVRCNTRYLAQEVSGVLPVQFIVDVSPPEMVYVDDSGPLINNPQYSYFKNELRGKWLGEDNQSMVTRYFYIVQTFYGKTPLTNLTPSLIGGETVAITGINLTDDTTYMLVVYPENAAGLIGEPMESDGVTVDFQMMPATCNDSVLGIDETDVDCGGVCPSCAVGMACLVNVDCQSGFCDNLTGTCAAPACDDGIRNGDEAGIDCGGSCTPCGLGAQCLTNADCDTGNCVAGLCTEPDPCLNGILDGTESDIDCGGVCAARCAAGSACIEGADCDSGLCINGVCEAKRPEGEPCEDDSHCISGLVCKDGICKEKKVEAGGSCTQDSQCEEGFVCYNSACSLDSDGDGLPDDWEVIHGLDPSDPSDAMADLDGDGISNAEEYRMGTNPANNDSDGDGWFDGEEVEFGTDPLDPDSMPSAWSGLIYHPFDYWWLWLLIILILLVVAVLVFFGYRTYKEYKEKKAKEKKPKPGVPGKAPARPGAKPWEKKRELTPEERKILASEARKDREIATKLDKLRGFVKKKEEAPGKKVTKEDWVGIDKIVAPISREKPAEVKPVFQKLEKLKKGKLGLKGREKALAELDKLIGKKAKKLEKEAEEKKGIIREKGKKESTFAKLSELGEAFKEKLKGKKEKEKAEAEKEGRKPFGKLRMLALANLTPAERKKIMEKLLLLRTGKLSAAERKELFDKLRITAGYYKAHKEEFEREISKYIKKKPKKKKAKKPSKPPKKPKKKR